MRKLILLLALVVAFSSCKKEEIYVYNTVVIAFSPNELLTVKTDEVYTKSAKCEDLDIVVNKPSGYYAYFIVNNEVIHEFDNIKSGTQEIEVQERAYDNVIVSSVQLSGEVLSSYNNDAEYQSKLLYSLPETSDKLIMAGNNTSVDVTQSTNITVNVHNPYALVVAFNMDYIKTSEDVSFIEDTQSGITFQYLFIKEKNATVWDNNWSACFKYCVSGKLFNSDGISLTSNKIKKLIADKNVAETVDGNFNVVEDDLYTETTTDVLPAM